MAMIALVLAALAATVAALPVDPEPSLKHDTDVVRMAPPNRRMFLVDLIRPASTSDPLLTNEIGTSADAEIPRLVRLLVTDQRLELDAASKGLSRPRPFASADLSAPSSTAAPVPSPAEDLLPPAAGQPDQWAANVAQPREDVSEAGVEVAEPSGELQPPAASATGVWELYEGIKMVEAGEVAAEAKAESRADEAGPVAEPATELLPPPAEQPDILSGLSSWTARLDSTAASDSAPAKLVVPEAAAVPDVPEPATHLLPPAPDSYVPAQPSSGQAGADDFLTLAAAPPAADARAEYVQDPSDKRDSYLPEAGELKFLAEGPIVDDFLAIGEPPKQEEAKGEPDAPTTQPKEGSSETTAPAEAAGETSATSKEDPVKDSYSPTSEETSAIVSTQEDAVKEHVTDQDHDHEYVELEAGSKGTEDVGVNATEEDAGRKKRHICKTCGGYGGYGGAPTVTVVVQKPSGYGGGGGYCDVCGRPVYRPQPVYKPVYKPIPVPVYKPVPVPVYKPVPVPVYKHVPVYQPAPTCHTCNQPPPPCNTCGGGGPSYGGHGGGSYSQSSSSSSSSSSSYSSGWGK